jgi:VIT1/CCC1 family predicted Fe2+/Mn2+ transporter
MTKATSDNHHLAAETDHLQNTGSGVIRASVFGVSDGLVSNLALVMGVAGGTSSGSAVILAGSAGLMAGAFSMAVGEYVSMQTQREVMERELQLEREHILLYPDEEQAHLKELLSQAGLDPSDADRMAKKIHERIDPAVDFHALLELGIVPGQLGSPLAAAFFSFLSFVVGAAVPLLPWLLAEHALVPSLVVSAVALLVVGGIATTVTHRHFVVGALRQLFFGAAAAAVTFVIGHLIGTYL